MSSFDVVRAMQHMLPKGTKIGHGGTLDPFASGLLLLLLGSATKTFDHWQQFPKTYVAGARLGYSSDSLDVAGTLSKESPSPINSYEETPLPSRKDLLSSLGQWTGEIEQSVPDYSAGKVDGVRRADLARAGKPIPPKMQQITVYDWKIIAVRQPLMTLEVTVSSGTYVRQLVTDWLREQGQTSFLYSLTRTRIGDIGLEKALSWGSEPLEEHLVRI